MSVATPDSTATPAVAATTTASWWQRRRAVRRARPMYKRADRSAWRSIITLLLPLPAAAYAAYAYFQQDDIVTAAQWGGGAAAAWLLLSPFALWWAVSALRRGTRLILTSVLCGILSGFGTVGLVTAIYGAAAGWSLMTGQPLPEPFQDIQVPLPQDLR